MLALLLLLPTGPASETLHLSLCTGELGLILSGDSLSFSGEPCCEDARALPLCPQDAEEEEEEGVEEEDVGPGGCAPAVSTKLSVSELSSREGEGEGEPL